MLLATFFLFYHRGLDSKREHWLETEAHPVRAALGLPQDPGRLRNQMDLTSKMAKFFNCNFTNDTTLI